MHDNLSKEDKKAYGTQDNKWRAEGDVRSLSEALQIKGDDKRLKMAMHCAKMQAEEINQVAYNSGSHNPGSHNDKMKY